MSTKFLKISAAAMVLTAVLSTNAGVMFAEGSSTPAVTATAESPLTLKMMKSDGTTETTKQFTSDTDVLGFPECSVTIDVRPRRQKRRNLV